MLLTASLAGVSPLRSHILPCKGTTYTRMYETFQLVWCWSLQHHDGMYMEALTAEEALHWPAA